MVEIVINFPNNTSFLSGIAYEGLLYLINKSTSIKQFSLDRIVLSDMIEPLRKLNDSGIESLRVRMTGNDNINSKLFQLFNVKGVKSKKVYSDLLRLLKVNADKLKVKDIVHLSIDLRRNLMLIDVSDKKEGVSIPQILKIDRYTGISSLDTPYMTSQITAYISKEVALILLLGLYSSFVTRARYQERNELYFFLVFSPEEVTRLLSLGSVKVVRDYFNIKDEAKNVLREVLARTSLSEALAVELALNIKLRELLREHNLEKISLTLFKISPEGQTYKIYEQIPIVIYRMTPVMRSLGRYYRDPETIINILSREFTAQGALLRTLANTDADEHEDVVEAVINLYRFVVLGDPTGWYMFLRKVVDAHKKVEGKTDAYLKLLSKLSY